MLRQSVATSCTTTPACTHGSIHTKAGGEIAGKRHSQQLMSEGATYTRTGPLFKRRRGERKKRLVQISVEKGATNEIK